MSPDLRPARRPSLPAGWLASVLAALLAGCGEKEAEIPAEPAPRPVMALAQEYVAAWFDRHPEQSLAWGRQDPDPDRLTDNSLDAVARWQILQQDLLAQLDAALRPVDEAERAAGQVLRTLLQDARADTACRTELRHVDSTGHGWLSQFMLLAPRMLAYTVEPPLDGLERIAQMAGYADTEIDNLREGLREDRLAPLAGVRAVTAQVDFLLAQPLAESPFFAGALNTGPAFRSKLTGVLREQVMPAFARYRYFLADEYAPAVQARGAAVFAGEDADCLEALSRHATGGGAALAQLIALVDAHDEARKRSSH